MSETTTPSSKTPLVDFQHPWLGLLSFKEAHRPFFFGRDAEIAEILGRIRENTLTILFGQSGLGKTSLIGAAVMPELRERGFAPVHLKLDYFPGAPSLLDQTLQAFKRALPESASSFFGLPPPTLWEIFHRTPPLLLPGIPVPVLIFDQFEEIFTLGRQSPDREREAALWLEQIADLLQNRPPPALEERFAENRRLARDYDFSASPVRIVFALREDYLSHLEGWKNRLPLLTQNRMALQLLNGPQALEAVLGPASLGDEPLLTRDVAASIVRTVADVKADIPLPQIKAVPPLLSLLCEQLNDARIKASATQISAGMVSGQSADILQRFYVESFAPFPQEYQELIRALIEDPPMITEGGYRNALVRDDAEAQLTRAGMADARGVFDALIQRRLITVEEKDRVQRLEVTHDVLVPMLVRSRKERRDRVAKEQAERALAEEAAKTRKRRLLTAAMALLTAFAIAGGYYGLQSAREAAVERQRAIKGQHEAEAQRDEARYNEGLGWLLRARVAEERKAQYPGTLLCAALAIGFDGVGRPENAPAEMLRFIRQDLKPDKYNDARAWIADHPAYLPVWASAQQASAAKGLTVSSDGRRLALSRGDGSVSMWDFRDGKETIILAGGSGVVEDIAFHPNGQTLSIATDKAIRTWDIAKAAFTATVEDHAARIAWNPGGHFIVAGGADGSIRFWQDGQLAKVFDGFPHAAANMDYCRDSTTLAASIPDAGVRVLLPSTAEMSYAWNQVDETTIKRRAKEEEWSQEETDKRIREANIAKRSAAVAVMPGGNVLVSGGSDGTLTIWDLLRAEFIGQASQEQRHTQAVTSLSFRPDGQQFASASADGLIRLWRINEEQVPIVIATLTGHVGAVTAVQYAPGGDVLASAGEDGSARLWDVSGRKATAADLYAYVQQHWYELDGSAQDSLRWAGGTGFANVPQESGAGVWQAGRSVETPALPPQRDSFAKEGKNFSNATGIHMIWCPAGEFDMGSPDGTRDGEKAEEGRGSAETKHRVKLTRGFWLAKYELTQPQWAAIMGSNRSTYKRQPQMERDLPIENISWYEAVDFCHRLTDRERAAGTLPPGYEYALPSEAQWEYACRARTPTAFSFGDDANLLFKFGNYNDFSAGFTGSDTNKAHDDHHIYTAPIGSYDPNPWDFHDMHGNVFEWCMDSLDMANADYSRANTTDPLVTQGALRVDRGGGWYSSARDCRSAYRYAFAPSNRGSNLGFRPAVVPSRPAGAVAPGKVSGSEPGTKR